MNIDAAAQRQMVKPAGSSIFEADANLPGDLKGACQALEAEFLNLLMASMRKAMAPVESEGSIGMGLETSMSMLDNEIARIASEGEGQGLWKYLYEQLDPQGAPPQEAAAGEGEKAQKGSEESADSGIVREMGYIIG